jgi:hypothetical protein
MRIFDITNRIAGSGEYILGADDTGSHACYLIYGVLKPGEQGRELKPGNGHEELVLALQGDLQVTGHYRGTIKEGQAVHLRGDEALRAGNDGTTEAVYVIAGGHSNDGHR